MQQTLVAVGDVHGKFDQLSQLLWNLKSTHPDAYVLQVGDLGIGFEFPPFTTNDTILRDTSLPFGYFAGNHDNPVSCAQDERWVGKWGVLPFTYPQGQGTPVFFIGGAFSIDYRQRVEGVDWWREEELSMRELLAALDAYAELKPELVFSHDCPLVGAPQKVQRNAYPNRTQQALNAMWALWQPKLWVFGHHHETIRRRVGDTQFVGLSELEAYVVEAGGSWGVNNR